MVPCTTTAAFVILKAKEGREKKKKTHDRVNIKAPIVGSRATIMEKKPDKNFSLDVSNCDYHGNTQI